MKNRFVVLLLLLGTYGCSPAGDPASLTVEPSESAPGRRERLWVSGPHGFASGPISAEAGPGVTVVNAVVRDAQTIAVEIEVAPDAELGPRDLSLRQQERVQALAQAFAVLPPFETDVPTLVAGSRAVLRLAGSRTSWHPGVSVTGAPQVRVREVSVEGPADLILHLDVDLFASAGPVWLEVGGERHPAAFHAAEPVVEPLAGAIEGRLSGSFRVWTVESPVEHVARFRADGRRWEIFATEDGFEPRLSLGPAEAAKGVAVPGGTHWIVLRDDAPSAKSEPAWHESPRFAATWTSALPIAVDLANPNALTAVDGGIAAFRLERIAPFCIAEVTVSGGTTPLLTAIHPGSWSTNVNAEGAGSISVLVPASAAGPRIAIWDPSASGSSFAVHLDASPMTGTLFPAPERERRRESEQDVLEDVIAVDGWTAGPVGEVRVALDLREVGRGEVAVTLTSPTGKAIPLVIPSGDAHRDWIGVFPDLLTPETDPTVAFVGEDPNGEWTLSVTGGESPVLRSWALALSPHGAVAAQPNPVEASPTVPCYVPDP